MSYLRKLSILIIILVCNLSLAQNLYAKGAATVMGEIKHSDNRPAVNVIVSVENKFSITDIEGRYLIKNVPFGSHTMQIKENRENGQILKEVVIEVNQSHIRHDEMIP